ncbi:MAG: DUF7007 domain-containing protein [Pyrinomonadaceae bacterium]
MNQTIEHEHAASGGTPPVTTQTPAVVHPTTTVRRGAETPWGRADSAQNLIPGIGWAGTPSHGGCVISNSRLALMPDYMREGNHYEEDCKWSIVYVVFEEELLASGDDDTVRCISSGRHKDTLRDWYPELYERFYGETIPPGRSVVKDEQTFHAEHADDLLVVSAFGDWHSRVPKGMVGVVTQVGGRGPGVERYFLIGQEEYDARGRFPFVVDPAKHEEIEPFC